MSGGDDFAGVLARIAASARATNRARAHELDRAVRLQQIGRLDAAGRESAARAAHQLAGSAGTFGDLDVVEPARRLEAHFSQGAEPADATPVRAAGERALEDVRAVLLALGAEHGPDAQR